MKVLYLSYLTDEKTFNTVFEAGLEPSVARQKFEVSFMSALLDSDKIQSKDITILSCVPYNERIKEKAETAFFREKEIEYIWWERGTKSFVRAAIEVQKRVCDWYKENRKENCVILTYATNPIIFLPVIHRKCKMITICSEVPRFRVMGSSLKAKLKKEYYHFMNEKMDGYVFLTQYMNEVCNKKQNPYVIVEGMPDMRNLADAFVLKNRQEEIFYAGGINAENGILELLEAFVMLDRKDVVLTLCGVGNVVEQVRNYAENYSNIVYRGAITNTEVLELERHASLLINPRKADESLTRYSFPSKTFEYFCSGTPCIISRLEGIPDEYFEYCYECDSSSPEALCKSLKKVLAISQEERLQKAEQAYNFILREKTAEKQTEKIVGYLYKMSTHKG